MNEQDIVSICATIMLTSGYAVNMAQAVTLAKSLYDLYEEVTLESE